MKETVRKYSREIDLLTRETRHFISERDTDIDEDELLEYVEDLFFGSDHALNVEIGDIGEVITAVFRRARSRFGILREMLEDPEINEIMVNGPDDIFIERNKRVQPVDDAFTSCDEVEGIIRMFAADVHREVNDANPIVDARLENGFRVNGVLRSVALNGPILTIRKFAAETMTMDDLVQYGSITNECSLALQKLVRCGYNIFISGGTSSGKTTFLNALTASIDGDERAITIEDSAELRIDHLANRVSLECRSANSIGKGEVTMDMLIRTSLRMRPDRIIVGEVRGREVIDMIQAMSTGHDGSMSTGHGNSIKGMLSRLETMYLMDSQIPMYSIRSQIANAIDIFVHLRRDSRGRRSVVEVAEVAGFDGKDYILNYLFETDREGRLVRTGKSLVNTEKLRRCAGDDEL
jgi:pilus assembly protein CpaF